MRIIYLHQYFNTREMAGSTRSYEIARRLVAKGHQVEMVTSWRENDSRKGWFETEADGIRVHWLPVRYSNQMSYSKRIAAFITFALGSAHKAASLKGDVVYATSTPLTIALPGIFASRWQRIPMIFEVRDLWPELPIVMGALRNPVLQFIARKLELLAYRNSAHIVALSPGMANGVTITGYPRKQISIIPNSSDLDLFQPNDHLAQSFRSKYLELGNGPIILYPGTIGRINRVEYMAYIAAEVLSIRKDCRFVVIGEGIERDHVQSVARELGVLNRNFYIYTPMPKKKLVDAFCAATVIISTVINHPVMQANCANKFFDALASGTPVAINYKGWQAEVIERYGAGLVLPGNYRRAANKLLKFLNNPEKIARTGASARKLAISLFSRDRLANKLEKLIVETVCDSKKMY